MNNGGWVQMRRGILDHLVDGRLTANEFTALTVLILLADGGTGGYTINAPTLLHWTGGDGFNIDTARRVLASLHDKQYIWYRSSRSRRVQRYFVNKYLLTKGPMKSLVTNLAQLFDRESICVDDVLRLACVPTGVPTCVDAGVPTCVDAGVPTCVPTCNNNTGELKREKETEKETNTPSSPPSRVSAELVGDGKDGIDGMGSPGTDSIPGQGTSSSGPHPAKPGVTSASRPTLATPGFVPTYRPGIAPTVLTPETQSAVPASDAARRMAQDYLKRQPNPKKHAVAAASSWPAIFDGLLAGHDEGDLTAAIEWAWNDSDFWPDKLDRRAGDPVEYLAEHSDNVIAAWRRERRSGGRKTPPTTTSDDDIYLGGLLNP
jgi:hypothetical protein